VITDFGADDIGVGIAVGAFAFGAVVLRPFAGRIGDRSTTATLA
jgi:MFS family permease